MSKPTYSTSTGERLTTSQIETRITYAKGLKLDQQLQELGYNRCEDCLRNATGTYLDCSHDISVKECKESGQAELAFDVNNIMVRCRDCHKKHD